LGGFTVKKLLVLILMLGCSFTTGTGANAAARKYIAPPGYHQERRQPGEERRWLEERRRQEEERRKKEEVRRKQEEEQRKKEEERRRQEEERRRKEEDRRRIEEDRRRQEDDRRRMEDDQRRQEEQRRKAEERRRWEEDNRRQGRPVYPQPPYRKPRTSGEQFRAKQVLRETADCLIQAQRAARYGNGNGLGMAYTHQQQAWKLYYQGFYRRSIGHSMRARFIANEIIRHNQAGRRPGPGGPPPYRPSHDNLDDELSIKIIDDNIAIRLKIDLD
jgi:hypothetical protein